MPDEYDVIETKLGCPILSAHFAERVGLTEAGARKFPLSPQAHQ
jgi:hypothetical protein